MKPKFLIHLMFCIVVAIMTISCKESKTGLAPLAGSVNEVLVIMDKPLWEGAVGDTVKSWFTQDQFGLPQSEPMFNVLNLPNDLFDKNVKAYRNIFVAEINPEVDSATIQFADSPWAKTQKFIKIQAPDNKAFLQVFEVNKQRIMNVFLKAEQDRLIASYKKTPSSKIYDLFKDKYHIYFSCPADYNVNKTLDDFVWLSRETNKDSKGIIFFEKKYKDVGQFQFQQIIDTVNAELERNIPGPVANTCMTLDTVTPWKAEVYNYDETHYAVRINGLWKVKNDFMGGPYVLNVVLDEKNNRIVYMLGYVYAPDDKKRNMLRQVEAIVYTADLDFAEPVKNTK